MYNYKMQSENIWPSFSFGHILISSKNLSLTFSNGRNGSPKNDFSQMPNSSCMRSVDYCVLIPKISIHLYNSINNIAVIKILFS